MNGDCNGPIEARTDLNDSQVNQICDQIRTCGFGLHKFLSKGFREKVYERGMVHRLAKSGLNVVAQPRVKVYDEDGTELIEEIMDLIVERVVIVELKAVRQTTDADIAQLLGYQRAARFRHGLLMNFGGDKFYIRKYVI